MLQQLTTGFGQTLLIFFLTLLFSLPLGMVVYFGRVSRFKPLSWIVKAYISIMRGTPLMLQLLLWYFGPFYLWGMNIGNYKFTAIILGCSLNYAAYFAEIYRSGIESIPVGQYEAAQLLGYNKSQTFFKIVLPQAFKVALPSMVNQFIITIKDTSILSVIGLADIVNKAKIYVGKSYQFFATYIYVAIAYLIVISILMVISKYLEKRVNYERKGNS